MLKHGHAWCLHVNTLQESLPHALKGDASSREEQQGDLRDACRASAVLGRQDLLPQLLWRFRLLWYSRQPEVLSPSNALPSDQVPSAF